MSIKTIEKYIKWAMRLEGSHRIYRGLGNKAWKANSSLERKLGEGVGFAAMLEDTQKTLAKAKEEEGHIVEKDKELSDLEMLICLQHYGMETFLIDFTSNPLVALWFACQDGDRDMDGKVISVNTDDAEEFVQVSDAHLREEISCFSGEEKLYKLEPSVDLSERIATQNSVFIFGAKGIAKDICENFRIPKEEKGEMLTVLREKFGVHKKTVFPDFTSYLRFHVRLYDFIGEQLFESGRLAYSQGDIDNAIKNFGKVLIVDKGNFTAYNNRGIAYANKGEYNKAIDDLRESINLNPNDAKPYNNLGIVYNQMGEHDNALKYLGKAIDIDPNYADAYSNRGIVYGELKKYDRAIEDFDMAIKLNPNLAAAYTNRGVAHSYQKKYDEAIYDFSKVIEINPNHKSAYSDRGQAYLAKQEYNKAIDDFDVALELNPNDAITYNNRGSAYGNQGEHSKAEADFRQAVKLDSNYFDAHKNLGLALRALKDEKGAQKAFARARELAGSPPVQG